MEPSDSCPAPGTWKTFLDGDLLDEAAAELAGHLESCEACQQTLERLAAGKETWEGTAKQLAEADANAEQLESSGHLQDVLNDLKHGIEIDSRAANITPESLTFLAPSDEEDSIGRLGSYEVLEIVGAGGMGIVMRAWDPSLRRIVAIKVLASHLANSAAARRRFVREAQAAAAVSHDHVVAIHAVESDHEPPYLVMQYIEGKTLQQRLDGSGPLHVREVLRIGQQTALGLSAAHQQGIVHRDIKPANILLENGVERVRITDFGLARAIDDASMTQSGVVAGTPLFMAPEQAQGIQLDHRADLFSLGSVLYVMCTGRPPFRSSTMIGVIRRVCDDSPRPIREINPDIPEWLCAIIDRLLAKDPKDRYASAEEVAGLLGSCLAHVQQPTVVPLPAGLATSLPSDAETVGQVVAPGPTPESASPTAAQASESPTEIPLAGAKSEWQVSVTPDEIRREVFWPAAMMIAAGVLNGLILAGTSLYVLVNHPVAVMPILFSRVLSLIAPVIIVYGAMRMRRMESRLSGIVAAIVCVVSGPCHPLSWPAAIWAIAVLMRPHVQREFVRISRERVQPVDERLPANEVIPDESRPVVSFGQYFARTCLLIEAAVAGAVVPVGGILAFTYQSPSWIPGRLFIAGTGLVIIVAIYVALALYRYGFAKDSSTFERGHHRGILQRMRSLIVWWGTLAGLIPCVLIVMDINATTYNDFLSGAVVPVSVVSAVLLIVAGSLNLNRAHAEHKSGSRLDPPILALLDWPTPLLAVLWTASVAWADFQDAVGYVRFQIDDHNSWVTLTSDDSQVALKQRGGWTKARVPEGKYHWTVSDAGLDSEPAVSGTVEIESPRTSVVDAKVHGPNALDRVQGYWKIVSTDVMWSSKDSEKPDWAKPPTWIVVDDTRISYWDSSGKPLGPWTLKLDAENTSPKLLQLHDVSNDERLAEGQWAVGQNELLLRLYPPRKTTSPYLASIFSKPVNGDLVVFRFDKLPKPPPWLDSDSVVEIAAPIEKATVSDSPPKIASADSDLDGRWILDSMLVGPDSMMSRGSTGEIIFAGGWLLCIGPEGVITKGVVTTRTDVSPKQIRIEELPFDGVPIVMHGVYRVDDTSRRFRNLEVYFLRPGFELVSTDGEYRRLSAAESNEVVREKIGALTDRCFDQPPDSGEILFRTRLATVPETTAPLPPNVEGKVLDTKPSKQNGRTLVEVSVGKDDGLKVGHELIVYRFGEAGEKAYVAKIRLELVTPDRSVGTVVERRRGDQIEIEDRVMTEPLEN